MADQLQKIENPELLTYDPEVFALIEHDKLQQIAALMAEYKGDIITLVSVFKQFEGLFSGKVSAMSILPVITKLIANKAAMNELAAVLPVIEKYTNPQPQINSNENNG